MSKYKYRFTISVTPEGGVEVDPLDSNLAGELVETTPNIHNIIDTARKLVADLERQLLMDNVAQVITSAIVSNIPQTTADAIKEKLQERGIELTFPGEDIVDVEEESTESQPE